MGDMETTTQTERKSSLSIDGRGRIILSSSNGKHIFGCSFDGRSVVHPAYGTIVTLNAEKTAELVDALASVRPEIIEDHLGTPADVTGWEYVTLTDESGEYMPVYRRTVDEGHTASVAFGAQDVA